MVTSKPSSTNCPNFSLCINFFECTRTPTIKWLEIANRFVLHVNLTARSCTLYDIQVAIVAGFHLFPFRTEKLSPFTPMVLRKWESRSLPFLKRFRAQSEALSFFIYVYCYSTASCYGALKTAATYSPLKAVPEYSFLITRVNLCVF